MKALTDPPVPEDHAVYEKCVAFLGYIKTTWMEGLFEDLWRKWTFGELRTTNLAEAFHK